MKLDGSKGLKIDDLRKKLRMKLEGWGLGLGIRVRPYILSNLYGSLLFEKDRIFLNNDRIFSNKTVYFTRTVYFQGPYILLFRTVYFTI